MVDDTGGFCVLQSDISAQHLPVFGPLTVKKGNNKKYSGSQAQTSEFFVFHRRVFAALA